MAFTVISVPGIYMMRSMCPSWQVAWLSGLALALVCPTTANAQASVVALAIQPPAAVIAMASTNSMCITITYDKNGNRVSQTVGNMTTSTTNWGSGTYGCFVWKQ